MLPHGYLLPQVVAVVLARPLAQRDMWGRHSRSLGDRRARLRGVQEGVFLAGGIRRAYPHVGEGRTWKGEGCHHHHHHHHHHHRHRRHHQPQFVKPFVKLYQQRMAVTPQLLMPQRMEDCVIRLMTLRLYRRNATTKSTPDPRRHLGQPSAAQPVRVRPTKSLGPPVWYAHQVLPSSLLGVMVQALLVGGTVSGKCRLMSNTEQRQPVSL